MTFGEKIRNAREELELSQADMAKYIPMNQSNYSKIERDVQEPSVAQLRRICQLLSLDPRYLLELNEFEFISSEDLKILSDAKKFISKYKKSEK